MANNRLLPEKTVVQSQASQVEIAVDSAQKPLLVKLVECLQAQ
jgi:hypothetical protein